MFANYSEGISTGQQYTQSALNNSIVGPLGVPINPITGVPIQLNNTFAGNQTSLYRTTNASLTASMLFDRDTFSVTAANSDQILLSQQAPGTFGSNNNTYGNATWSHTFSEATTGNIFVQYGNRTFSQTGNGDQRSLSISLSLTYAISETLTARAQYTRQDTLNGNTFGQPPRRDIALVGLHKTF